MQLRNQKRNGATTVEMALVAPILFTVFFGLMEWGRVEMVRQAMSTATFNGARAGIVPGATSEDVEDRVNQMLAVYFISGAQVTPSLTESDCHVHVSVPMSTNGFFLSRFFGDVTLEREFFLKSDVGALNIN